MSKRLERHFVEKDAPTAGRNWKAAQGAQPERMSVIKKSDKSAFHRRRVRRGPSQRAANCCSDFENLFRNIYSRYTSASPVI